MTEQNSTESALAWNGEETLRLMQTIPNEQNNIKMEVLF